MGFIGPGDSLFLRGILKRSFGAKDHLFCLMRIFACMASTLDGKIGPAGASSFVSITSPADLEHLKKVRDQADGILFGAETYRTWPKVHRGTSLDHRPHHFILSRTMDLAMGTPLMDAVDIPVTVIGAGPSRPGEELGERVDFISVSEGPKGMGEIIKEISKLGIDQLLIEGGGRILQQFIGAGLVDDLYLTLSPRIMGDPAAPALLGDAQLDQQVTTEILSCTQKDQEIYLHLKLKYDAHQSR